MKKINKYLTASCLCEGVSISIKGQLRLVINCHCIQCTKTHGNFATYTNVLDENIIYKCKKTLK